MQKNIVSKVNAAIAGQAPKTQQQFNEHVAKMKSTMEELKEENQKFSNTIDEIRAENEELKRKIEQLVNSTGTGSRKKRSKTKGASK